MALDDKPLGAWVPGTPLVVPPGEHTVEFSSDHCYPKKVVVGAAATSIGEVRLDWRPATLRVRSTPLAADVVLSTSAGRRFLRHRNDEQFLITIPAQSLDGRELVRITASADGYRPAEAEVRVVAGQHEESTIILSPVSKP